MYITVLYVGCYADDLKFLIQITVAGKGVKSSDALEVYFTGTALSAVYILPATPTGT